MEEQRVSEEMVKVIKRTHKFSTAPWRSAFGVVYIGFGQQLSKLPNSDSLHTVSKVKADKLLRAELEDISKAVHRKFFKREFIPQHYFDVFVHLCYDHSIYKIKDSSFYITYYFDMLCNEEIGEKRLITLYNSLTSRILAWSRVGTSFSKAMNFRRRQDVRIFSDANYDLISK